MLSVNSSSDSLRAQRFLNTSENRLKVNFERLSSGLRVNRAADDAAGLSISTRMQSQIQGIQRSIQNATDWTSLFQTAEGGLNEINHMLQRMRELTVQANNGTLNDSDRGSLDLELKALKSEIDHIAEDTSFNGIKVLNGELQNSVMQLGADSNANEYVSIRKLTSEHIGQGLLLGPPTSVSTSTSLNAVNQMQIAFDGKTVNVRDTVASDDTLSTSLASNSAIAKVAALNDAFGGDPRFEFSVRSTVVTLADPMTGGVLNSNSFLEINGVKVSGFTVQSNDADGALVDAVNAVSEETGVIATVNNQQELVLTAKDGRNIQTRFVVNAVEVHSGVVGAALQVFAQADMQFLGMDGVNGNDFALSQDTNFADPTVDFYNVDGYKDEIFGSTAVSTYDISSLNTAQRTLKIIDLAIEDIAQERSSIGAQQNRLEHTISNLSLTRDNLSTSQSRIIDADFADETASLAKNQIIQQAGISVLAQANQSKSIALSLIN
jgi:flagellin